MTNDDGYYGTWGTTTQAAPSGNYWQNLYNPNGDYARCYWDTTHVLSAYAVYEFPIGRGKQFGHDMPTAANAVVGNWSINPIVSWHYRLPAFSLRRRQLGNRQSGKSSRLRWPGELPKDGDRPGHTVVQSEFVRKCRAGDIRQLSGSRPSHRAWICRCRTSACRRTSRLHERMRLQFRADFLNAFNHPNFAVPNDSVGAGLRGQQCNSGC